MKTRFNWTPSKKKGDQLVCQRKSLFLVGFFFYFIWLPVARYKADSCLIEVTAGHTEHLETKRLRQSSSFAAEKAAAYRAQTDPEWSLSVSSVTLPKARCFLSGVIYWKFMRWVWQGCKSMDYLADVIILCTLRQFGDRLLERSDCRKTTASDRRLSSDRLRWYAWIIWLHIYRLDSFSRTQKKLKQWFYILANRSGGRWTSTLVYVFCSLW